LLLQGEIARAIEHTRAGRALDDRAQHDARKLPYGSPPAARYSAYLSNCAFLALSLWLHGAPGEARAVAAQALELANAISDPFGVTYSSSYSAVIENLCGNFARARDLAQRGLEVARSHQLELWAALAEQELGQALAGQGQFVEGIARMQQGNAEWTRAGARAGATSFYAILAEAELRAGKLDDATASLATAEAMVTETGENFYEPELARVGVRVAHRRGRPPAELLRRLRDALAQAAQQDAGSWTLRLASDLVELTRGTDLAPDAPALLDRAIAAIVGGEDTADLARARAIAGAAAPGQTSA
jgi:predicted ATPase